MTNNLNAGLIPTHAYQLVSKFKQGNQRVYALLNSADLIRQVSALLERATEYGLHTNGDITLSVGGSVKNLRVSIEYKNQPFFASYSRRGLDITTTLPYLPMLASSPYYAALIFPQREESISA